MKKSNIVKVLFALSFFVIAILLVVGAVSEAFDFGIWDGVVYLAAAFAAVCLISAFLLDKKQGTLLSSGIFGAIAFGCGIIIGLKFYWAIVFFILYAAVLVALRALCFRGKTWDGGDNQRPGYRSWEERKASEEAGRADDSEEENPKRSDGAEGGEPELPGGDEDGDDK